jgi:hypothetical protein
MIERIGYPLVLFSMLTIVLVETGVLTTGIVITIGLNIAMIMVVLQAIALLYGFAKSLILFYKMEQHPLFSPIRIVWINAQNKLNKKEY